MREVRFLLGEQIPNSHYQPESPFRTDFYALAPKRGGELDNVLMRAFAEFHQI